MNTEEAYNVIAKLMITKAGDLNWDQLILESKIYDKMSSSVHWAICSGEKIQGQCQIPLEQDLAAVRARLFLRDNILQATNERIWGLTFTLNKDFSFNIDYNYDKPEDFESQLA